MAESLTNTHGIASRRARSERPPTRFWVASGALFLWHVIGCVFYLAAVSADPTAVDAATRAQMEATPLWATAAYAVAVWAGLGGAIALLLRKRQARGLFVLSFLAVIVQNIHAFALGGAWETKGPTATIIPALVILFLVLAMIFARRAATRGWIR